MGYVPLLGGDGLGDFTGVGPVVHEEELDVGGVPQEELPEAALKHVAGLLGRFGPDLGLQLVPLESTPNSAVHTMRESPRFLTIVRGEWVRGL